MDLGRAALGLYDPKDRIIGLQPYAGRVTFSRCTIDFEGDEPPLFTDVSKPYKPVTLDFGDFQYHGVMVAEYTDSPTVFICSIDYITYKDNP